MAKRVYCTYFDHNYLSRGLALYQSLQRHAPGSRLWVLCLSDACYRALVALDLANLVPRRLADFEAADPEVAATRPDRSLIEYYFTCSPAWKLYVLNNEPDAEWVTYLDSDLFFFASPEPIYAELKDAAFGIIPHHFTKRLASMRRFGIYNVGWVSVRHCDQGIAALRWWRERCIEWCHDFVDGDRFADQRYLDRLPGTVSRCARHPASRRQSGALEFCRPSAGVARRNGAGRRAIPAAVLSFSRSETDRAVLFQQPSRVSCAVSEPRAAADLSALYYRARCRRSRRPRPIWTMPIKIIRRPAVGTRMDHLYNAFRQARSVAFRGIDVVTRRAIAAPGNFFR